MSKFSRGWLSALLCVSSLAAGLSPLPARAQSAAATTSQALASLFDEIWQDNLRHSPEFASTIGDKRFNDQLSDYSAAEVQASLARGAAFLQRLRAIDTTHLSDQEKLSAALMLRSLSQDQEGARFKEWQTPDNQFGGFHADLPELQDSLQFDSIHDFDDYLARLHKMPLVVTQNIANMRAGIAEKRVEPAFLMAKVLTQVQSLANQKPEDSPFAAPLKKFPKSISPAEQQRLSTAILAAIRSEVLPAYTRYGAFLTADYIPHGRTDPGLWALPDGDAFYAFKVRQSTTLTKSPAEIHDIGLAEVARDQTEMLALAHRLGFADLKTLNAAVKANPKLHPTSRENMLEVYRGYIAQMQPELPKLFGTLPKAPVVVLPVAAFQEAAMAPAFYRAGTPDGKRPGAVYVNTYEFASRSLTVAETTAYHEGIPGHHLQVSIAQELTGLPEFRKFNDFTAYSEGWALYSERLGKEIGFYKDPYSDYGRLEADIWRAIRLVVDTGVHSQHWTRQQMVDYFHQYSPMDEASVQAEVDRYIAMPAQALGYKMGQLKILELREKARTALGPKFDIRGFHDTVIDSGALPLDLLEQRVDAWIASRK